MVLEIINSKNGMNVLVLVFRKKMTIPMIISNYTLKTVNIGETETRVI